MASATSSGSSVNVKLTYETERWSFVFNNQLVLHPSLASLHRVHSVKKIGAGSSQRFVTECAKVGYGKAVIGWLL